MEGGGAEDVNLDCIEALQENIDVIVNVMYYRPIILCHY